MEGNPTGVKNGVAEATPETKVILQHHKYAITHCRDGKYYTYYIDKDNKKRQIKRNTFDDMIQALTELYKDKELIDMKKEINVKKEITVFNVERGRYLISPFGMIIDSKSKTEVEQFIHGDHGNYRGHHYVNLHTTEGIVEDFDVSKLVMYTFNGDPPSDIENPTIDHINKDSLDDYYRNLRWLERDVNAAFRNNRQDGENNSQAKLTMEDVQHICNLLVKTNMSDEEIGSMYGVSRRTIYDIRNKNTWKHISLFFEFD